MKRLKTEELAKLSEPDLVKKINDLSSELAMLRSKAARGTLKKELGEIKSIRRNVARALTARNARRTSKSVDVQKKDSGEVQKEETE
ncbi:MAG: 50S ribosomal protein L29 [Nitrososphaerota archaeon]|nr:50S ribosomal protein L29 [Nitrososphaerota archaeon]MDG6922533.1 50S ribosomal protein L29 [Nitrososphaerota archaeon]